MAQSIKLGSDTYLDSSGINAKLHIHDTYSKTVPTATSTEITSFTVPTAGLWLITSLMDSSTQFTQMLVNSISVPSVSYTKATRGTGDGGGGLVNMVVLYLSQGAGVAISAYQSSGSDKTIRSYVTATLLAGERK